MQKHLHLIGAGGIGMSGLAQLFVKLGYRVTGSDRDYQKPENRRILDKLELQGITIYPQDGSYRDAGTPDFLVYSTAIEEDNPDFLRGEGIPRLHRSEALALALEEGGYKNSIAITGSCGKSTVTAYLAEALVNLNADPDCLNGGLVNRFRYGRFAGNYRAGDGKYFIFEADESDRSLVRYAPDYAVILNIGTDHYSKEELAEVFGTFLRRVKRGAVMARSVFDALGDLVPENLPVTIFEDAIGATGDLAVRTIRKIRQTDAIYIGGASAAIDPQTGNSALEERDGANNLLRIYGAAPEDFRLMRDTYRAEMPDGTTWQMPRPGEHNALNALAVMGVLEFLGFSRQQAAESLEIFGGVWRRFDDHGTAPSGARVFDD
ncbi:MAG: hypothetical protein J6R85_05555, partial [Lentisphaeria bacterium]|nr:hypothetical protein [Lentisphaeria bacterium]